MVHVLIVEDQMIMQKYFEYLILQERPEGREGYRRGGTSGYKSGHYHFIDRS